MPSIRLTFLHRHPSRIEPTCQAQYSKPLYFFQGFWHMIPFQTLAASSVTSLEALFVLQPALFSSAAMVLNHGHFAQSVLSSDYTYQ